MTAAKRSLRDYLVPAIVVLLAVAILVTSRWHAKDRYAARDPFAGCYRDPAGSLLELNPTGTIHSAGKLAGGYQIVSPVGGKHGYLVEASNLNLMVQDDKVIAEPGSGGFFWPISQDGELVVTFAPDTRRVFRKGACSDAR